MPKQSFNRKNERAGIGVLLALSVLMLMAPALSHPLEMTITGRDNPVIMPNTSSAPVFFRPPDPGVPVDVDSAATTGAQMNSVAPANATGASSSFANSIIAPTSNASPNSNSTIVPTDAVPVRASLFGHHGVPTAEPRLSRQRAIPVTQLKDVHNAVGLLSRDFLDNGNFLLKPTQDIELSTDFGIVKIANRSCVLVAATPKSVSVYDLHDTHEGAVVFVDGSQRVKLLPGWEITVTSDAKASFSEINPLAAIQHESLQSNRLPGGHNLLTGKFSIASALALVEPLRHDNVVLKTAVIQRLTAR